MHVFNINEKYLGIYKKQIRSSEIKRNVYKRQITNWKFVYVTHKTVFSNTCSKIALNAIEQMFALKGTILSTQNTKNKRFSYISLYVWWGHEISWKYNKFQ